MNLRNVLIDNTGYLWKQTSRDGAYGWFEDDHDLDVRATLDTVDGTEVIAVFNKDGGPVLNLKPDQTNYLIPAVHYAQFADGGEFGQGSVEQFWAYAKAFEILGGESDYGATHEGIYAHVGSEMVFVEWTPEDGYNLFTAGCHGYAATTAGLERAYKKVIEEVAMYKDLDDLVAETESET